MFEEDWVMRQVKNIIRFLTLTVLKKESPRYEPLEADSEAGALREELDRLIGEGKLCEAEDRLFDRMDTGDRRYLELAVDFYEKLNRLDNSALRRGGFSREEIEKGLRDAARAFGVTVLP